MPADLEVGIAEGFQSCDLLALEREDTAQGDVEQEGRDGQENRRRDCAHGAQALDLVRDIARRQLLAPRVGTASAVGFEQAVDLADNLLSIGARGEQEVEIVEGALHVGSRLELPPRHPEHAEAFIVRE